MGNKYEEIELKIQLLSVKIQENDFNSKPEYFGITECPYLDEEPLEILAKLSKITKWCIVSPIEILYKQKYEREHKISKENDKCSICQCEFYEEEIEKYEKNPKNIAFLSDIAFNVILLDKCSDHFFHIECIGNLIGNKSSFKCPICLKIFGILEGDMPNGTFKAKVSNHEKCTGYNCGTIVIHYNFPNGPGYTGTNRTSYLPNNQEGREILAMLKVAFDRKLTFTVGTSVTTGRKNTVVWNGIHHKTSLFGGPTAFGYPDPTYFNRVKQELAAKGVTKESIGEDLQIMAKKILNEI